MAWLSYFYTPGQCRREGGQGGASAPGPGPVVGAWAKLDFFIYFLIGSQWGIQDFDKGPPFDRLGMILL